MQSNCDNRMDTQPDLEYAGFWVRFAAYLLDWLLISAGLLVVRLVFAVLKAALGAEQGIFAINLLFHYTIQDIVLYCAHVLYFILCTYYTGTTPGKRAMNLRVIPAEEGGSLTFFTVVYRETVGRFLCRILFGIGYLLVGLSEQKCGLHDRLSDTRVIYAKRVKVYQQFYGIPVQPVGPNQPGMTLQKPCPAGEDSTGSPKEMTVEDLPAEEGGAMMPREIRHQEMPVQDTWVYHMVRHEEIKQEQERDSNV